MERLRALAGWLPAVILPTATLDQWLMILRSGSAENVSAVTWLLFLLANLGALFIARPESRRAVVQMALAFGLTALLDVAIVATIVVYRAGQAGPGPYIIRLSFTNASDRFRLLKGSLSTQSPSCSMMERATSVIIVRAWAMRKARRLP